jgi:hypothetical protein
VVVYIFGQAYDAQGNKLGAPREYSILTGAVGSVRNYGWTSSSFKVGDIVKITAWAHREANRPDLQGAKGTVNGKPIRFTAVGQGQFARYFEAREKAGCGKEDLNFPAGEYRASTCPGDVKISVESVGGNEE